MYVGELIETFTKYSLWTTSSKIRTIKRINRNNK